MEVHVFFVPILQREGLLTKIEGPQGKRARYLRRSNAGNGLPDFRISYVFFPVFEEI